MHPRRILPRRAHQQGGRHDTSNRYKTTRRQPDAAAGSPAWKAGNEASRLRHSKARVGYRLRHRRRVQNEAGVGNALHSAGVNRDELSITTKLWNDDQNGRTRRWKESLASWKPDYVDLTVIRLAGAGDSAITSEAWQALIDCSGRGYGSIGVCNFPVPHLQS